MTHKRGMTGGVKLEDYLRELRSVKAAHEPADADALALYCGEIERELLKRRAEVKDLRALIHTFIDACTPFLAAEQGHRPRPGIVRGDKE